MSLMTIDFSDFQDEFGLICKPDQGRLDGGDTAANEGTRLGCLKMLGEEIDQKEYETVMNMLEPNRDGIFVRHPDKYYWHGSPDRMSRDNMIPLLFAMIAFNDTERANRFWEQHKKRFFLYMQNYGLPNGIYESYEEQVEKNPRKAWKPKKKWADPTLLEFWSLMIRAAKREEYYSFLPLLDVELLLGSLYRKYISDDRDVRNHILGSIAAISFEPTAVGRLAFKANDWTKLCVDANYWWGIRDREPPIHRLLIPLIVRLTS